MSSHISGPSNNETCVGAEARQRDHGCEVEGRLSPPQLSAALQHLSVKDLQDYYNYFRLKFVWNIYKWSKLGRLNNTVSVNFLIKREFFNSAPFLTSQEIWSIFFFKWKKPLISRVISDTVVSCVCAVSCQGAGSIFCLHLVFLSVFAQWRREQMDKKAMPDKDISTNTLQFILLSTVLCLFLLSHIYFNPLQPRSRHQLLHGLKSPE